ncbi:MAG: DUF1553 domain-containing protein, partial [Bacteroidota bacterium]
MEDNGLFKFKVNCLLAGFILISLLSCGPNLPDKVESAYRKLPSDLDFNFHVKPILSDKCFACHGPDKEKRAAGLRLDVAADAYAELAESPGKFAIVQGDADHSEVFRRIFSQEPSIVMPPPEFHVKLSEYEKAVLTKWIEEGAEYKKHWAFIPPQKPAIPTIDELFPSQNPIDNFIMRKLEKESLQASEEATKELLLRRLSLDLTGLPPTLDEIDAFIANNSEDAYEKEVDRLLVSPHYGEKMATDWMDLARYSDTYGYQVDRYRDMSPWRDWVIQAFNENMPYDQFLIWQLAGDLLPDASKEQILATAFNRLHPQNMEDGIVEEEFRVEHVSDRVAVLGEGLLGLSLSCAKCHDHKYDPISQKEYFELFSFFNNINESGQISWDEGTPVPTLLLPTSEEESYLDSLQKEIDKAAQKLEQISLDEKAAIEVWIKENAYQKLNAQIPSKGLIAHYSLNQNPISNSLNSWQRAKMDRQYSAKEVPHFTKAKKGRGLLFDGDAWLDLEGVGIFKRDDAFTIGMWVKVPADLEEGVIFHKNKGTALHAYRGFHLYLKEGKLEWLMAHTYPENAIIEHSLEDIPREQWIHLAVSYDGSSTASGSRIFLNGKELETEVKKDHLTKDIIFHNLVDIIYPKPIEPNIKIGGRWRGKGFKGGEIDEIRVYNRNLSSVEIGFLAESEEMLSLKKKVMAELSALEQEQLEEHYLLDKSFDYKETLKVLAKMRSAYVDSIEWVKELMVMEEMPVSRKTFLLNRGVYDDYGEEVFPATPQAFMQMDEGLPKNRLGLAKWLCDPKHPLTARVAVNRYWQNYFGRGLVKTAADFGNQGELPSHPELLDWLAIRFMESGWDIKAIQKLIVMSATYRQTSFTSKEVRALDPDNKWLARGPKLRLTSEMIRDNALAASGLLNDKIGGESVRPYQPEGLWAMNFDPYIRDQGNKLYRRSLYTIWRRTAPNPTLSTFDQPERSVCTVKRQKTNTPLQALVLLNDPTFVEASKVIGENIASASSLEKGIVEAYRKL